VSGGAFPETPKGSPGAIEGAASRLSDAADLLEESDSSLAQTARGLSGVAWSGQAEGRFTASAGTLSGVCRGAETALRTCASATRTYAEALETARRIIEREREEFEDAQVAQANATSAIGQLSMRRMRVEPDRQGSFDSAIDDANADRDAAGDRAQAALRRAQRAREEFDDAQNRAIEQLDGRAPGSSSGFGAPARGMAGGGSGPAFPADGTGGWGAAGGGFGVPAGGLANLTGFVGYGQLGDVDGYAKSRWDELHGQTEVDDLTIAITLVAAPVAPLATAGARAVGTRLAAAGSRALGRGRGALATEEGRVASYEGLGQILSKGGVPMADEAAKITSPLLMASNRIYIRGVVTEIRKRTARGVAVLRAARELSHGVKHSRVSQEQFDRLAREAMRVK